MNELCQIYIEKSKRAMKSFRQIATQKNTPKT